MMQLILRGNNFEIYGNLVDLFSVRIMKTDVFHHFRKYEEAVNFMRKGTEK